MHSKRTFEKLPSYYCIRLFNKLPEQKLLLRFERVFKFLVHVPVLLLSTVVLRL